MHTIAVEQKEGYVILSLRRGPANPINLAMMQELRQFFTNAASDASIGGVVMTGNPGIFTAGLDVVELYNLDKEGAYTFWRNFVELATLMAAFPKPLVAAISGHSPAGGCVFACCADYRFMVEGEQYRIGLNEIPVGIVVPERILHLYGFWIGQRHAYQNLMEGKLMSPMQAQEIGLIDELCTADNLLAAAEAKLQSYLKLPQQTWQMSKTMLRQSLIDKMSVDFDQTYGPAMEQWWSPENRAAMGKLVAKLQK